MSNLEIKLLTDRREIDRLYNDPYISRTGHDHWDAKFIESDHVRYFGALVDGNLVGAFLVINSGFIELDIHSLLTKNALFQSRKLGEMIIAKLFEKNEIARITAYIVEGFESTKNYCLKLGFVDEGTRRNACQKNGKLIGVYTLGMTREDWNKKWAL